MNKSVKFKWESFHYVVNVMMLISDYQPHIRTLFKSQERESLLKICLEYQKLNFFCPFVSESTFVSRFKSVKKGNWNRNKRTKNNTWDDSILFIIKTKFARYFYCCSDCDVATIVKDYVWFLYTATKNMECTLKFLLFQQE